MFVGYRIAVWQLFSSSASHFIIPLSSNLQNFWQEARIYLNIYIFTYGEYVIFLWLLKAFFLWFPVFWLWCAYSYYTHPPSGFNESLDSVNYTFTKLRIFQPFFSIIFRFHFSLSSARVLCFVTLDVASWVREDLLALVSTLLSVVFRLKKFCWSVSKLTDSFINPILLLSPVSAYLFHILCFTILEIGTFSSFPFFWWNF